MVSKFQINHLPLRWDRRLAILSLQCRKNEYEPDLSKTPIIFESYFIIIIFVFPCISSPNFLTPSIWLLPKRPPVQLGFSAAIQVPRASPESGRPRRGLVVSWRLGHPWRTFLQWKKNHPFWKTLMENPLKKTPCHNEGIMDSDYRMVFWLEGIFVCQIFPSC